jgi:hypothetical protein
MNRHLTCTLEKFIRLWVKAGGNAQEGRILARLSRFKHTYVPIGARLVRVKK